MSITTFRDLLRWLDSERLLAHVTRAVDPAHEITTVQRKMQSGPNLGLLFSKVKGSDLSVACNILSRREAIAASLGLKPETMLPAMAEREAKSLPLDHVTDAPVHEVVHEGAAADVTRDLPQVVHSELDAGAYITAGIFLARHPDTGVYNASWNRTQIAAPGKMRTRMMPPQHLGQYQEAAEKTGRALPVACVIGAPPAVMLAAASKIPYEADELEVAGAWQGSPLRVVQARTQPLLVPADSEIVIEGEIVPGEREEEGPFGEFLDSYVDIGRNHVFRVTAVTRRRDAIHHIMTAGGNEDLNLLSVMLQVEVWKAVSKHVEVVDVGCPSQILGCVVSIRRKPETDMQAVRRAVAEAHWWMKFCVIVDADVDVHDAREVVWVLHARFSPDSGIFHLPGVPTMPRRMTEKGVQELTTGRLVLDATYPPSLEPHFRRRRWPGLEDVRLEDYIDLSRSPTDWRNP